MIRKASFMTEKRKLRPQWWKCIIAFLLAFSLIPINIQAQTASVTLDRQQILLGEHVTLQLKIDNVSDEAQNVQTWFNVPDTGNHIEVLDRGKIDTIDLQNGQSAYIQRITITSFDSGHWAIPVIAPQMKNVSGDTISLPLNTVALQVLPVDVSQLKDFHPEKSILQVKYTDYTWLYISIGIIILALIIFLIIRWLKGRTGQISKRKEIMKGPPFEWAMQQITLLEKENLIEKGEGKLFFIRLDDICRIYFDERTQSHTLQSTSMEMIEDLRKYLIREKDRQALIKYTKLSTSVKFAKHLPAEEQGKEAINITKETITSIEKQVIELNKNNAH
ncbi:hypothetical protein [Arachidicoccus soli]|uniref:Protein BatD n=1 Tax=Arachidicoccus soli TaxID=2341117 RepID=A0A386HLB8_9BACT|nr:hypothetical protein [Arachidicoccus soli]AYD46416.1 hypothetical protein D6B99_01550 [Arachidicoccus soli]